MERADDDVAAELMRFPRRALPERLVAFASEAAGAPVALYLVDISGHDVLRAVGDDRLPGSLPAGGGVGPELDLPGVDALRERLRAEHPEAIAEGLWLVDRAVAVLAARHGDADALRAIARATAPVFELVGGYTDVVERARRSRAASPAAEVQLGMLSPRIARVERGWVIGSILPAYAVGGDWFDHADNPEGTWISVADAMGKGPPAAALGAIAVGALRAARRRGADVIACCEEMHAAVWALDPDRFVTAFVSVWDADERTLRWANAGHMAPLHLRDGEVAALQGETTYPLGVLHEDRPFTINLTELAPGDRLLVFSDGIVERRLPDGEPFGTDRLAAALRETADTPPIGAVAEIERRVFEASDEPVRDDATQLLLEIDRD